ncbi:MAG: glycosyltransferase family 39 protein, partial [Armatimonadota bacterium]|nr:glycosyltransferase family 39 protein [Armatimonadota bacterium]
MIIQAFLAIISLLATLLICAGFGRLILRAFAPKHAGGLEGFLFAAAIGMGALSYLILALGLIGLLYPTAVLILMLALMLVSRRNLSRGEASASASDTMRGIIGQMLHPYIGIPIAVIGVSALIGALAPPSFNDWDALAYHLAVPSLYIKWHAIKYVPFTSHSNLPFLMEMLYAIGLLFPALGGAALAKLFHFAAGVLTVLAIYVIGKKHFSPKAGAIGAAVFAAIPLVGWEATAGYIDLATSFYVVLAVLALLNHWDEGGQWGVLAFISLGLAAATKTTALAFIPVAGLW